jgi:hypothetical protein
MLPTILAAGAARGPSRERWMGSCELSHGALAACVNENRAQSQDGIDNKRRTCRRFLVEVEDSVMCCWDRQKKAASSSICLNVKSPQPRTDSNEKLMTWPFLIMASYDFI